VQRAVRRHVESAEVPAVQYYVAQSLDGYIAGRLRSQLALAGTQVFSNGMVELRYGVAR